jgi:hypothetical protein
MDGVSAMSSTDAHPDDAHPRTAWPGRVLLALALGLAGVAFLDGYNRARRFAYEFRVAGATPSGFEPGHVKPAAVGGRWHTNGGGWVGNGANVASTAYEQWAELTWTAPVTVDRSQVYLFDDVPGASGHPVAADGYDTARARQNGRKSSNAGSDTSGMR